MRSLALVAALLMTACNGTDDPAPGKACDGLLKPADPAITLPATLPAGVADPVLYDTQRLGATTLYFGHAPGADVVSVRDAMATAYEQAGKAIESRDEEPPAEAEFQFSAAADEGSVQVTPLCQGRVTIRWRIGPR